MQICALKFYFDVGYMTQKIDAIVEKLTELFEDYTTGNGDYFNLFVTGHR